MKICIPSESSGGLEDTVGYHFGRVDNYTIYDTENEKVEIIPNTSSHKGGTKLPAELLQGHGIDIMICGGLGRRAIQLFEQFGIEVYSGAKGTIDDAIKQFENGSLNMATDADACREHKYHDESKHKK
ncbi:MAG: NifB/NifX family molybdenum-iron cluster-binding protein [Candidatus Hodarchaeales archaeon]